MIQRYKCDGFRAARSILLTALDLLPLSFAALCVLAGGLVCLADDKPGVTYTIPAEEALNGPKPSNPNYILDPNTREASIAVDVAKPRGHVNPLVLAACFEDLDHEIYGGFRRR